MFLGSMAMLELAIIVGGVLVLYGAACLLIRLTGTKRALTGLVAVFLASLFLLGFGEMIEAFGVALRSTPLLLLAAALGLSAVLIVAIWAEEMARRQGRCLLRWAMRGGMGLLCAVMVTGFAVVLLFTALGGTERVVEYQGQVLVERDVGFLDSHYLYYVRYGPLFRGSEVLFSGEQRLC